jgi:hypothetical protein
MRGHRNERSDFLFSTLPAVAQPEPVEERDFAQVAEGGGYSTELVVLNGSKSSANVHLAPVMQNGVHFKPRSH